MVNGQPPLSFTNKQPGTLFVLEDHLETDALCVPALGEVILHSSFVNLIDWGCSVPFNTRAYGHIGAPLM